MLAQWTRLPRIVSEDLNSIVAYSDSLIVIVGSDGVCIRTEDGGASWKIHDIPSGPTLLDAMIKPNGSIIAVGNAVVYESLDSGKTWISLIADNGQDRSWANGLLHVRVMNDSLVYSVGVNGLFKSTNGGRAWSVVPTSANKHKDMEWITDSMGYVVGGAGMILRTRDAGASWEKVGRGVSASELEDVFFINADTGIVTGGNYEGVVVVTTDGGDTWSTVREQKYGRIWNVSYSGKLWWMTVGDTPGQAEATADVVSPVWDAHVIPDGITDYHWFADGVGIACSHQGYVYTIRNHGIPDIVSVGTDYKSQPNNSNAQYELYDLIGRRCSDDATGAILQFDRKSAKTNLIYR